MGTYMSSEDMKNEFVKELGPGLGIKYFKLHNQVIYLHGLWTMISELMESQERRSLLANTGRSFFLYVRKAFLSDLILGLSRLIDPHKQHSHENLSLEALLEDITDPCLKSRIKNLIEEAEGKISPMKQHRDKRIAHSDLPLALDSPNVSLPPIDDQSFEEALSAVGDVLNHFWEGYTGAQRIQEWVPDRYDSPVERLVFYLEAGVSEGKTYAKKQSRLKRGKPRPL